MNNSPKPRRKGKPRSNVQQAVQQPAPGDVVGPGPALVTSTGTSDPGQALTSPQDAPGGDIQADAPAALPNAARTRGPGGRFIKGHPSPRLSHGLYSDAALPPELASELSTFMAAQLTDEGQVEVAIPARRRSLLGYRGTVHQNILKLSFALSERGLIDARGKLRVTWLSMLMALMDRAVRLDGLLGLERTPRQIPQTPRQWLEGLADQQVGTSTEAASTDVDGTDE